MQNNSSINTEDNWQANGPTLMKVAAVSMSITAGRDHTASVSPSAVRSFIKEFHRQQKTSSLQQ